MNYDERTELVSALQVINRLAVPDQIPKVGFSGKDNLDVYLLTSALCRNYWQRSALLGPSLSCEIVWRMLFELFVSARSSSRLSVSDLSVVTETAIATTIRWLGVMSARGLINRVPDRRDKRRIWIELTAHGIEAVEAVVGQLLDGIKVARPIRHGVSASPRWDLADRNCAVL